MQWLLNGLPIPGETGLNYSSNALTNNALLSFQVNSTAVCANPTQIISNVIAISVMPNANPSVSIYSEPSIACTGQPITITATALFGGLNPQFKFRINGVILQDGPSNTFTSALLNNDDVVSVIMSSNYPCLSGSNTVSSNILTIEVASAPTVEVAASQDTIIGGQSTLLTVVTNATTALYMWEPATYLVCEVCESTLASPLISTTYLLTLSDVNTGCVAYDTVDV
jgi:hypothetical protein